LGACVLKRVLSLSTVDPRRAGPPRKDRSASRYLENDTGILRTGSPRRCAEVYHRRCLACSVLRSPHPCCSAGPVG
jgi:hypothetical protein